MVNNDVITLQFHRQIKQCHILVVKSLRPVSDMMNIYWCLVGESRELCTLVAIEDVDEGRTAEEEKSRFIYVHICLP